MKKKWLWINSGIFVTLALLAAGTWWFLLKDRGTQFKEKEGNSTNAAVFKEDIFYQELETYYPELYSRIPDGGRATYTIPGVVQTVTLVSKGKDKGEADLAEDMTPQGLAFMEDMVAISAYSKGHKHRSVIWLLDKKTGQYLKSLVLPTSSHVGGLAYDPEHQLLWVTTTDDYSVAQISALTLKTIQKDNFAETGEEIAFDEVIDLEDIKRSSYMTYHDGALYVGYFDQEDLGHVGYFPLDNHGIPLKNDGDYDNYNAAAVYDTPEQVQGMAFYKDYIVFSQSFGEKDSTLLYFKNDGRENWSKFELDWNVVKELTTPEYMEQIIVEGDYIYLLFESSAAKYREKVTITPVDRVIKMWGNPE